jgi:hypothetical protein
MLFSDLPVSDVQAAVSKIGKVRITSPCKSGVKCNAGPSLKIYPSYGSASPTGLSTCTFASIANWEEIVLGFKPNEAEIGIEFSQAGGTESLGVASGVVFNYWENHEIAGTKLRSVIIFSTDQVDLQNGIDSKKALIAELKLSAGSALGSYTVTSDSTHWVVVVGYTPSGPLVVTWGHEYQMTWKQWEAEVSNLWGFDTEKSL